MPNHFVYDIKYAEEIECGARLYFRNVYKSTYLIVKNEHDESYGNTGVFFIESAMNKKDFVAVENPDKIITNFHIERPFLW